MGVASDLSKELTVEQAVNAQRLTNPFVSQDTINNQIKVLKTMGFTNGAQVNYFNAEIESNPQLKKTFEDFEKDFTTDRYKGVLSKIGAQVLADGSKVGFSTDAAKKANSGIIDKLAKDLSGKDGPQVIQKLRTNPDAIGARIDDYASGKIEMAAMLATPATAPAAKQPVSPAPAAGAAAPTAAPKVRTQPAAAPVVAAPAVATPVAAPTTPAPATPTSTQTTSAPAQPANNTPEVNIQDQFLTKLAGMSDADIKTTLDKDDVKLILTGMSGQAASKFGVNEATTNGFKKRVDSDPKLVADITTNMQNNPEFVRQLAKSAQNKTEPSDGLKEAARKEMTKVMENPEKLAEDSYVKELSQNMKRAESFEAFSSSGIGKMFGSMFGEGFGGKISGWIGQIFEGIKNFFSGLFGGKPVLSMTSGGNSMLPNVMINTRNFQENVDNAAAFARYRPEEMNALPIKGADGKFFHDVVTKDANGNETKRQEPNTITIKTAEGKDMKVIPATGNLMAQQMAGNLGADGRFTEGNVRVPVVTGIDKNGQSAKIESIVMSPAEFTKYKAQVDAEGQKRGGQFQTLDFQAYTAEDAAKAGKPQGLQIISVNAKSGAVSEPVETAIGNTPTPINNRPNPAANDQQYALQNNG